MRARIHPLIVSLIFLNIIFKVSCKGNGSLTFLIDDTGSMSDDIKQVRSSVNRIMDIVFNEKASLIDNMVLVTFNDPDAQVRVDTNNRYTFKRTLDAVYAHNVINRDCWEPSMNGLRLALETSHHDSYIYVFTDAPAKDYKDSYLVTELCQRKQSQIVFVLTGRCYDWYDPKAFDVYFDIAEACSGLAFDVTKSDVEQVLRTIEETIRGNKAVMKTVTVPPNVYQDIPFTIDEYTDYAIVSVSGKNVYLDIKGPSASLERIMWNDNGKVVKLSNVKPGQYVATVMGKTRTSVVIVGRTDFLFTHGFSVSKPKSLDDTSPQPIEATNVHLSISVTDTRQTVEIKSAQILQMDEKPIMTLPISRISKDFYVTIPFVAPSQMFKVAVNGVVKTSGKPISRIAKIPVTPQKKPIVLPAKKQPTAEIVEGKVTQVEYGSNVQLRCKVNAFPEPKITWYNSSGAINTKTNPVEYPYLYISYLNIPSATINDKYKCVAVNEKGQDTADINVVVKEPFNIGTITSGVQRFHYGKENTLTCQITSSLPMDIYWYYMNEKTGKVHQIQTSDKYLLSASHHQLTIRKMDLDLVGRYTCKAFLKNRDVEKSFSARVQVDGLSAPKLQAAAEVKVIRGKTAFIECKVLSGLPAPTFTWLYGGVSGSKFTPVSGTESVLRINNVDNKHAGKYKCVATNVAGKAEHVSTLFIQELPKITSNSATVYQATEGDAILKIPCVATGVPKPTIVWKLSGRTITQNAKYSINDGTLTIKDPKVSDTYSYTCEAMSEAGRDTATFKTYIRQLPKVSAVDTKTVRVGASASIECTIVKGEPKPSISWEYTNNSVSKFVRMAGTEKVLRFTKVENNHAGRYKCVAHNSVGKDEHITTLIVESQPTFTTDGTKSIEGIVGDPALRIPCDVTGVPPPVITWKLNGAPITSNTKYTIENGALVIKNPIEKDSSSYTCEAKNYIGSVSATVQVTVEKEPNFGQQHKIYLKYGENRKLKCDAYNSTSQTVRWFDDAGEKKTKETYVDIVKASVSDDGNYTCHVSDKHGNVQTLTYVVDVGNAPELEEPIPLTDWRGDVRDIASNCESKAKPEANVEWQFNGKKLTDRDLEELGVSYKWGHYTCNVSNPHGSVQRSFDVKSSACLIPRNLRDTEYMPLVLTDQKTWPKWETTKYYTVIEQEEKITLACPAQNGMRNTFKNFPKMSEIKAHCNKEDTFLIDGKLYKLSDLQCNSGIQLSVVNKKVKCLTEKSELIRVGYNVGGFLETYEVCFDHANNLPLYTRALISDKDGRTSPSYNWFTFPGFGDGRTGNGYTCKNSLSSCCYGKSQLQNARDFKYSPAKNSAYIDPLNAIPVWRPCDSSKTSWEKINNMVRSQIISYGDFVVWSGTHTMQKKHGAVVPRYLWKVVRFDNEQAVAIVHVNDPTPTDKDIKCTNICTADDEPWFNVSDKFTYCCSLSDFFKAFNIRGTDIGESLDAALDKIEKSI